ncbi:MAG: hypothetical protein JXA20_18910 [Spirochaetes bacterium]|nr:hypothetical protein [Spirochaetota bacterium]
MGVLKDVSESLLKYGEIIVNKTEEYSKILKLKLDIKKIENEIETIEQKVGRHVIATIEEGRTLDAGDPLIAEQMERNRDCRETIDSKKNEIEMIKKAASEGPR